MPPTRSPRDRRVPGRVTARRRAPVWIVAGGLALVLSTVGAAVLWRGAAHAWTGPIILISVDTLRADRVGAYGYSAARTPAMDELARDGVLFERALSHSPQTLPSHASILSGRLPFEHGVRDNVGFSLRRDERVLPGWLRAHGYRTAGFVSAFVLRPETGIGSGFDHFDGEMPPTPPGASMGSVRRDGAETVRRADEWLARQPDGRFFLFVHLYEPHRPWRVPAAFAPAGQNYDAGVSYADHLVGRFVRSLKSRGWYEEALVVLLSDHGEGLGDHGEEEHGVFLYDETTRVPLVVKQPGRRGAGTRTRAVVQLVDLVPTILDRVGAAIPEGLPGRSRADILGGDPGGGDGPGVYAEALYPRYHFGWSELYSLTDSRYRYVLAPSPELYDLQQDPGERHNIAATRPSTAAAMRRSLEAQIGGRALERPSAVPPEDRARFQALGYIGQASEIVGTAGERRPDPKAHVHTLEKYRAAVNLSSERRLVEAIELFREVVREQPSMLDVWVQLGHALMRVGRHREAVDALKRSVALDPGATESVLAIAVALLRLGDLDGSREHAALVLKQEPARAREILARVALARGQGAEALAQARLAQQADPTLPLPAYIEGALLHRQGEHERAIPVLQRAVEQAAARRLALPELHATLGDALAHAGRDAEAEAQFKREIEAFPENAQVRASLALLYEAQGRQAEARRTLSNLVATTPTPESHVLAGRTLLIAGDARGAAAMVARGLRQFPGNRGLMRLRADLPGGAGR